MNLEPLPSNPVEMRDLEEKIGITQEIFNRSGYSHLPAGSNNVYYGSLSENDAFSFDPEKKIKDYNYALEGFYVRENESWLNMLQTFSQNQSNILPVLNDENRYLGIVELEEIIQLFTDTPFLKSPGSIFVLEKGVLDYTFSEISQIVESNGGHVLGNFVSKIENDVAQIVVKIAQNGLNSILQSFRRYGYSVVSHHQEDIFRSNLRERSKYLDKYLNI